MTADRDRDRARACPSTADVVQSSPMDARDIDGRAAQINAFYAARRAERAADRADAQQMQLILFCARDLWVVGMAAVAQKDNGQQHQKAQRHPCRRECERSDKFHAGGLRHEGGSPYHRGKEEERAVPEIVFLCIIHISMILTNLCDLMQGFLSLALV